MRPEVRLLNLHFFNICRDHPTLKFKPHATDDERYVSGIDGVPLSPNRPPVNLRGYHWPVLLGIVVVGNESPSLPPSLRRSVRCEEILPAVK